MARGGRGGRRGGSRGRGAGFAQSVGVANKWSDSKKGAGSTALGKSGGSNDRTTSKGRNARGQVVSTRTPAGDKSKTRLGGYVRTDVPAGLSGAPHPVLAAGRGKQSPKVNRGGIRGKGGSN